MKKILLFTFAAVLFSIGSFCQIGGLGKKLLDKAATVSFSSLLKAPDPITTSFKDVDHAKSLGPDEMIKIVGDNFRSESRIFFGNIETDYIRSMDKTTIYVRVPPNAVTAPVKVISPTSEVVSAINFTVPPVVLADAITTSLTDAKWGDPDKDGFVPREPTRSIFTLQRTPNGGFVLTPGYYAYAAPAFSLKAGRQVTSPGGMGYLYAPPKGPREDAVMTIVRNSVNRPEVLEARIQELIDAILRGVKWDEFTPALRATASTLLTPRQMSALNTPLPAATNTPTTGSAIVTPVQDGRWSIHPDGYYVKYKLIDSKTVKVEIWVPQGAPSVGKEFDPATHIAVPADVTKDRMILSGRMRQ